MFLLIGTGEFLGNWRRYWDVVMSAERLIRQYGMPMVLINRATQQGIQLRVSIALLN